MIPRYTVKIHWSEEDKAYIATVPELPGCMADGQTEEKAFANVRVIAREWRDRAEAENRPVPAEGDELY